MITRPRLRRSSSPRDDFRFALSLYSTRRILVNINPSPGLVEGRQLKPISRLPFRFACSCLHRPFDEQFDLSCYYSSLWFSCSQPVDRPLSPFLSFVSLLPSSLLSQASKLQWSVHPIWDRLRVPYGLMRDNIKITAGHRSSAESNSKSPFSGSWNLPALNTCLKTNKCEISHETSTRPMMVVVATGYSPAGVLELSRSRELNN